MAKYADLVQRAVAVIIDSIILILVSLVLGFVFFAPFMMGGMTGLEAMNMFAIFSSIAFSGLMIVINLLYFTYFEGTTGQTIGKKMLNIKVTTEGGKQPTMMEAFVRTLLRIIDGLPTAYILGLILVATSDKKQRLGDMAAKTIVVRV